MLLVSISLILVLYNNHFFIILLFIIKVINDYDFGLHKLLLYIITIVITVEALFQIKHFLMDIS